MDKNLAQHNLDRALEYIALAEQLVLDAVSKNPKINNEALVPLRIRLESFGGSVCHLGLR